MGRKAKNADVWEDVRKNAVLYAKLVIAHLLKEYVEPERAGTPKGEPIGLSKRKYHAALLMVLYPKGLRLKDIAEITGTSEGLIRLWRTESSFKEAMVVGRRALSGEIVDELEFFLLTQEFTHPGGDVSPNRLKETEEALSRLKKRRAWMRNAEDAPHIDKPFSLAQGAVAMMRFYGAGVIEDVGNYLRSKLDDEGMIQKAYYHKLLFIFYKAIKKEEEWDEVRRSPAFQSFDRALKILLIDKLKSQETPPENKEEYVSFLKFYLGLDATEPIAG